MRMNSLGIVALIAGLALATGCKKDDKKNKDNSAKKVVAGDETQKPETKTDEAKTDEKKADEPKAAGDPSTGAAGSMTKEQVAEASVKMFGEITSAATSAGEDCDKVADAIQAVVDKNKDLIAKGKEFDKDPEKKKWFEENYGAKVEAQMKELGPVLKKCQKNKKLEKVFKNLM